MQRVCQSTTRVWSRRCRGTFRGANRMALRSHLWPAFLPGTRLSSFICFGTSFWSIRTCFSYLTSVLTLVSLLPFSSPSIFSNTGASLPPSLALRCLDSSTRCFESFSSRLSLSCDPMLLLDPVLRCLYRGGLRGVSSRPFCGHQ